MNSSPLPAPLPATLYQSCTVESRVKLSLQIRKELVVNVSPPQECTNIMWLPLQTINTWQRRQAGRLRSPNPPDQHYPLPSKILNQYYCYENSLSTRSSSCADFAIEPPFLENETCLSLVIKDMGKVFLTVKKWEHTWLEKAHDIWPFQVQHSRDCSAPTFQTQKWQLFI